MKKQVSLATVLSLCTILATALGATVVVEQHRVGQAEAAGKSLQGALDFILSASQTRAQAEAKALAYCHRTQGI